jgi:hypothetical protein
MNKEKNIIIKRENQPLQIDIYPVQDWEGFDELINFIVEHYAATILEKADGPDARRWIMMKEGKVFELIHHDMVGNFLIAPTEDSESIILEISAALERNFANNNKFS